MGGTAPHVRLGIALGLWLLAAVVARRPLEATMGTHMLVQIPLLAAAGALAVPRRPTPVRHPDAPALLLLGLSIVAIWMLPRLLDGALERPTVEAVKLVSIPVLGGALLGWSWPRTSPLVRSIVWAQAISMFLTVGWLYRTLPDRVCSFYLRSEQVQVGTACLLVAAGLSLLAIERSFGGFVGRIVASWWLRVSGRRSSRQLRSPGKAVRYRHPAPCDSSATPTTACES